MFVSRAITSTSSGHRYTSSAKFKSTRQINLDELPRISDADVELHPTRGLIGALVVTIFCPLLGLIALFYSIRAVRSYNQGFYAEAITANKKSIRWSLLAFIFGLILGSITAFIFSVKSYLVV